MNNTNANVAAIRETITVDITTPRDVNAEISIIARELRIAGHGALSQREYIDRARAIVLARRGHAADCLVRAIRLAVAAPTDADADRLTASALRFLPTALRLAA